MNLRWSLKELYPSFDSKRFKGDLKRLDQKISQINQLSEEGLDNTDNSVLQAEEYITLLTEIYTLFELLFNFAQLTLSVDAKNQQALKVIESLEEKEVLLTKPSVKFQKWIAALDGLEEVIVSSKLLTEHSFFLQELAKESKYLLSEEQEVLIAKMSSTASKAWEKLYDLLTSTLLVKIELDGVEKQLPLPVIRNMAYEDEQALRRKAYQAELNSYKQIEDSIAAALNGIKGEVLTISEQRGYQSPLEKTLLDSRMETETLEVMFKAIKEYLPLFNNYYRKKAELLGYQAGLPFYELFAPIGEAKMRFTYDQARKFIVGNFRSFSDDLAAYADNAFAKHWIDAEPRSGKRGGAFCSNIHPISESRILANFTGSLSDVLTLAHELGHGYHGSCLVDESIINSDYPMPLAETASIFCETIIQQATLEKASQEEKLTILESSISDAGQVIVDIYSRYLFESEVFERRKNSSLAVEELKEMMIDAQKKAYGRGLDHDCLHPYMWLCKPHYYSAGLNYYNFPYAFGLLFAKGIYAQYLEKGQGFIEEYNSLLAVSGKESVVNVAKTIGINVNSIDFWRDSLDIIKQDIEEFLKL
ncbi:pepF/M3 family oligoendopeptidase [Orenia metallireducens]|uniref:Oligoendopeptidase, pepF/M3 family n=1 Tax=Orenia metallireducens TaxID=1413210 RepID=A0A285HCV3_9FIRM|nr:M3 family oligoendopeptidase [Orenia metallireducens]PRX27712.1 pepF/M3 family oligoendopeptidase [Orenia metallireducens]SNY33568.1 oligoendopeptidase, pepF/M3 family [Orenia metallireducens]